MYETLFTAGRRLVFTNQAMDQNTHLFASGFAFLCRTRIASHCRIVSRGSPPAAQSLINVLPIPAGATTRLPRPSDPRPTAYTPRTTTTTTESARGTNGSPVFASDVERLLAVRSALRTLRDGGRHSLWTPRRTADCPLRLRGWPRRVARGVPQGGGRHTRTLPCGAVVDRWGTVQSRLMAAAAAFGRGMAHRTASVGGRAAALRGAN